MAAGRLEPLEIGDIDPVTLRDEIEAAIRQGGGLVLTRHGIEVARLTTGLGPAVTSSFRSPVW